MDPCVKKCKKNFEFLYKRVNNYLLKEKGLMVENVREEVM